jgi:hypothetical protein
MAYAHKLNVLQPVQKRRGRLVFGRRRRATVIDLRLAARKNAAA